MVFRFFFVFFLILTINSNANSECAFTDEITGGQEGFTNDAGICITRVHRQVFRMTVKCNDRNFDRIIWDGDPQVGDFIDTLGCNSLTFRSYTRTQNDSEELYTGCMVTYKPVLYENGWHARPITTISENANWDFSLINSRGGYCKQPADVNGYLVRPPGQVSGWRSLDNTAFITLLYRSILDRAPDPAGLKHWIGLLEGGKSRESVMRWFFKSPEYKTRNKHDYGFIRDMYQATHGQEPSPHEVEQALNKLSRGSSRQQLLDAEIYSNSASSQMNTQTNNSLTGTKQDQNNNSQGYTKQSCNSVVGKWRWFDGNFATFSSDGTMGGNPIYFWRCNGINPVRVTVNWNNKGIDKLTLSPDGNRIEGKNQYGTIVWGTRMESQAGIKARKKLESRTNQRQQVNQQNTSGLCQGHSWICRDKFKVITGKFKKTFIDQNKDGKCDACGLLPGKKDVLTFQGYGFSGLNSCFCKVVSE